MKCSYFLKFLSLTTIISLSTALAQPTSSPSHEQSIMATREALARDALAKDPKSEAAHLALANILMQQNKRSEAKQVITDGLALNKDNLVLKNLSDSLSSPAPAAGDIDAQKAALLTQLKGLQQILSSASQMPSLEGMREAAAKRREALDKKYGISAFDFPADLRPPLAERRRLIMDLRMRGDGARLLEELKKEFEENKDSLDARLEYAEALVHQNQDAQALSIIDEALKTSPQHPFFRILKDGINAKLSATSTELRQAKTIELTSMMVDARTIKSEKILKNFLPQQNTK